jgi:hypothetical protein
MMLARAGQHTEQPAIACSKFNDSREKRSITGVCAFASPA